jgi:hypothetical protein
MSETNASEASTGFSRFHLPPSHPQLISKIPRLLPHERVFPIQIGSELFKLSGASLSSDGTYDSLYSSEPTPVASTFAPLHPASRLWFPLCLIGCL